MKISFIVCTYNAPDLIKRCLNSILRQKFSGEKEIILVDGGSDKATLDVLNKYKSKNISIVENKKRLPEGYGNGKWLGWKKCHGEYVFIVDQDNELQGTNCVKEMLEPFEKEEIFGCLCITKVKENDNLTNKYIALMGTDPFVAYRSLDGIKSLKKFGEDRGSYTLVELTKDNLLITGGNCFVYKKKYIDSIGGYVQDTENIAKLVKKGYNKLAVPKKAFTHHYAIKGFMDFIKKKRKWALAYQDNNGKREFSYYPKTRNERKALIINLFFIATIFPNIFIAVKQYYKSREKAWFLHPILSFITAFIYFFYSFLRQKSI